MRRFAVAGNTVLNRYNIPRAMQALREETVNQVDLQRQVIQHFVQLANCAEFVAGAEGMACHNRLIEVVTELAEENMTSGLMCQADIQPADPSRCMPDGGDPTLDWCDCVTPQQFINNSLISPFLHRILLNYGDLGGSLAFGLSMNAWHQYRSTIGIPDVQRPTDPTDPARPAIDAATDWLSQPGWDQDVMPFVVQDVSVIDDDPFTTDPGTIIDENLILEPNKPHSAVQFLLAHSINPALNLCDVASTALDEQFMLDAWDDYQNLGGWLKGPAEIMQGMAFGIGIFDTCNLGVGNTPVVTITAPANGTIITVGTPITLMATANDVEDGDISAAINWSSNLDGNLGMGASVMATLGVGQHTLTAAVTDSDNRTGVASVMVTVNPVGGNAPVVVITSPVNGSMVDEGVAVTLAASAMDVEDGDLTAAIVWSSSLDGNLGTGGNLMRVLSVGQHTLTASVTDSSMLTSTDNVTVTVNMNGGCSAGLVMDEDFENGLGGWTSSGLWHRVTNSACGAPGFASPVSSVYFGEDADCDFDTGAREMGELISPVVSGIDASSVLRFSEFREVEFEPAATVDQTEVAVRAVGSMNWTPLLNRNSQDASNATWEQLADLPLAAFAGQSIQIRFLFDSDDEQFNQFTGWMIDDVQVTGCVVTTELFSDGFED